MRELDIETGHAVREALAKLSRFALRRRQPHLREAETFDGIVVPTQRHIRIRNEDRTPDPSWIPITLDLGDVRFSRPRPARPGTTVPRAALPERRRRHLDQ